MGCGCPARGQGKNFLFPHREFLVLFKSGSQRGSENEGGKVRKEGMEGERGKERREKEEEGEGKGD